MFRLADQGKVWWPVTLSQATGPDEVEEVEVWLLYRIFNRKELRERQREITERVNAKTGEKPGDVLAALESVMEVEDSEEGELVDRIEDWRGFGDGEAELEFSPERLKALLEHRPIYSALRTGLFEASRRGPRKNSKPGPGGKPAWVQA